MLLIYLNRGRGGLVKELGMGKHVPQQLKGFGKIVSVSNALVDGHAELDGVAQLIGTVLIEEGTEFLLADNHKDRICPPVKQVKTLE